MILSFWRGLKSFVRRVRDTRDARNSALVINLLALACKPFAFAKGLLIAWFFGASLEMDAYNMALGVLGLFVGTATSAMENAVLPALARARAEAAGNTNGADDRDLMALTTWALLAFALLLGTALLIGPGVVVRFFAPGFDQDHLIASKRMMLFLLVYGAAYTMKAALDTWANHTERYTVPQLSLSLTSPVLIVTVLSAHIFLGSYSVALGMSLAFLLAVILEALCLRDYPLRIRSMPSRTHLIAMGRDFSFCLALVAVGTLYMVVDRYFASQLPVGGVTALNNAVTIFGVAASFGTAPLLIFLAKSSRIAADGGREDEAFRETAFLALAVALVFCLPAGAALAALAGPTIRLLLGYGAYRDAVDLTANCLVGYSLGLFFTVACNIFYRVAQAGGMLPRVTAVSLGFVAMNGLLDWLLLEPLGAPGLALATTLTLGVSVVVYGFWLLPGFFGRLRGWRAGRQTLLALAWAAPLWGLCRAAGHWDILLLPLGGAALLGHCWGCERRGWLDFLPPRWRPSAFWGIFAAQAGAVRARFRKSGRTDEADTK